MKTKTGLRAIVLEKVAIYPDVPATFAHATKIYWEFIDVTDFFSEETAEPPPPTDSRAHAHLGIL
jgi:hypothetical protein